MNRLVDPHTRLQADARHRLMAIDPARSLIVDAPAGAGKTELLTQRLLALLAQVSEPEEVVALTFTQKAAAEMRHRVTSSLHDVVHPPSAPRPPHKQQTDALARAVLAHSQACGWDLLRQSHRLQITTLDALCARLARQMPLLSRLGQQPAIADDPQPLYAQAAAETLQLIEDSGEQAEAVARVLGAFDHDRKALQRQLEAMLARRDGWLDHQRAHIDLDAAQAALLDLVRRPLQVALQRLAPAQQRALMPAARWVAEHHALALADGSASANQAALAALRDWTEPLGDAPGDLPAWQGLTLLLLTQGGDWRKRLHDLPGMKKFSGPQEQARKPLADALSAHIEALREIPGLQSALLALRPLAVPVYQEAEREWLQDLLVVLQLCLAQLWLAMRQRGQIDFTQMAQNALLALGDDDAPSDLQLQLDYRIRHLLIDEFQDTSPTQVRLLERLTAGWQDGDGRTLFLVGDPMQSIYRFRKADVGLFLRVQAHGVGALRPPACSLSLNNRSHPAVVDWINASFAQIFADTPDAVRGAVCLNPSVARKPDVPHAGVWVHPQLARGADDEGQAPDDDWLAAQQVLQIIASVRARSTTDRIAILVRARSQLPTLLQVLREAGLRFRGVDIEPLAQRQVIEDLCTLTRALLHEADRAHALALLRAPWCGLTLADLHALVADAPSHTVWDLLQDQARLDRLSPDGRERAQQLRQVWGWARQQQGRLRPRQWIEACWQALGGALTLLAPADAQDAHTFFEVLERLDEQGQLAIERLDAELAALYAAPDPQAPETLQVMTIHKSKGLEFDVVILPGLHRTEQGPDTPLMLWDLLPDEHGHEHLVPALHPRLLRRDARLTDHDAKYDLLKRLEAERDAQESRRLLYVAATRAIRELHLLGRVKVKDEALGAPAERSLLGLLWPIVRSDFEAALQAPAPSAGPGANLGAVPASFSPPLLRLPLVLPAPLQALRPTPQISDPAPMPEPETLDDPRDEAERERWPSRLLADVGTLVHRWLEWLADDGPAAWPAPTLQAQLPRMQQWLRRQGHPPAQAERGAQEALAHLLSTLDSPEGQWVLQAHPEAVCEMPWTSAERPEDASPDTPPQWRNHVIDRSFVVEGVRWIIDYKTTRHDEMPEDSPAWQAYTRQLGRYQRLLAPEGRPVRLAVFFTRSGRLRPLPDTPESA